MELIDNLSNKSVILVGSNPNVFDKKYGDIIDSYDIIIRFNAASTEGIEDYVGSRTDLRIINTISDYRTHSNIENLPEVVLSRNFYKTLRNQKIIKLKSKYKLYDFDNSNEIYLLNFRKVNQFIHGCNINIDVRLPRIGFKTLVWLLYNNIKPTIYGFELDNDNSLNISNYYFTQRRKLHTPEAEVRVLNEFVKQNKVILLDPNINKKFISHNLYIKYNKFILLILMSTVVIILIRSYHNIKIYK